MFKNSSIDFGRAAILATCFTIVAANFARREPPGEKGFYLGMTGVFATIAAATGTKAARNGARKKQKTDFAEVCSAYERQALEALNQGQKAKALKLYELAHEALYHANGDKLRSFFSPAIYPEVYEMVLEMKQVAIGLRIELLKKEMQPEKPKQLLLGSDQEALPLPTPR